MGLQQSLVLRLLGFVRVYQVCAAQGGAIHLVSGSQRHQDHVILQLLVIALGTDPAPEKCIRGVRMLLAMLSNDRRETEFWVRCSFKAGIDISASPHCVVKGAGESSKVLLQVINASTLHDRWVCYVHRIGLELQVDLLRLGYDFLHLVCELSVFYLALLIYNA